MSKLASIAAKCKDKNFAAIYSLLDSKLNNIQYTADGVPMNSISHSTDEIAFIRDSQFETVKANYNSEFGGFNTLAEEREAARIDTDRMISRMQKDGFYNPINSIGSEFDPISYSSASYPLLIGPEENTAIYANGGIPKIIIDKKSKGVQLNGYTFQSGRFSSQELKDLQEYADSLGLGSAISDALRDGNIYGGSIMFPILLGDNPLTMGMTMPQLYAHHMVRKNCVDYFVSVDRWNTVVVPNYDLCAQDFLRPRSFYVPVSGLEVHGDRVAILRPNSQPYWGAIRNLGWGVSDFVSYMRSYYGYEIMAMSLPIMCQQMSLLVHELPLDGIIAQNGPEAAKKWQKENEEQLRNWSMLNPKAINSYGRIAVVNRSYSGFNHLLDAIRKDVGAKAGISDSIIFYTQNGGLFDSNQEDILLKQSETIRLIQRAVAPGIARVLPFIAASLWGCPEGYDSLVKYSTLQINFDTPVISSPSQKAEIGYKYTQAIKTLIDAGLPVDKAFAFVTKVIGEVQLPSDFTDIMHGLPEADLTTSYNEADTTVQKIEGESNGS